MQPIIQTGRQANENPGQNQMRRVIVTGASSNHYRSVPIVFEEALWIEAPNADAVNLPLL
jgi:hypothetical protein